MHAAWKFYAERDDFWLLSEWKISLMWRIAAWVQQRETGLLAERQRSEKTPIYKVLALEHFVERILAGLDEDVLFVTDDQANNVAPAQAGAQVFQALSIRVQMGPLPAQGRRA